MGKATMNFYEGDLKHMAESNKTYATWKEYKDSPYVKPMEGLIKLYGKKDGNNNGSEILSAADE